MVQEYAHLTALESELVRVLEDALWSTGYGVKAPIPESEKFKVSPWVYEARRLITKAAGDGAQP